MIEGNLYQKGQRALSNENYAQALETLLRLRERQLDLVETWALPGAIKRIDLYDVNANACLEVGALSTEGRLSIFSTGNHASKVAAFESIHCRLFRFFPHLGNTPAVILVGEDNLLSVFTFNERGGGLLAPQRLRELIPPPEAGEILDITYKAHRIFLAGANGRVCEYNAVNLQPVRTLETSAIVERLKTGGRAAANSKAVMHNHLLGVLRSGGLMLFDMHGGLREERKVAGELYIDAFVGDPDNDGIDNLVAISRDGKLCIYDWHSLEVKHKIAYPDEFYCLYCHDIDGDGILEMLVGARSNRIYAFAIGADGELGVKREYETDHRVLDLWVGDVQEDEKRLIAGLADGRLQVFLVHSPRVINRGVADAWRAFSSATPADGQRTLLAQSEHLEMVRLGLEELTPKMDCEAIVSYLKMIEARGEYHAHLFILSRLGVLFKKCQQSPDLAKYAEEFVYRLFDRYPEKPVLDRICAVLSEIIRAGTCRSADLRQDFEYFSGYRLRRQQFWPEGVKLIRSLIDSGEIEKAAEVFETVKLQELDLLRSWNEAEAITFVWTAEKRILFATSGRWLKVVDAGSGSVVFEMHYAEGGLKCAPICRHEYSLIVGHGPAVDLYDASFQVVKSRKYGSDVTSFGVFEQSGELFWTVGLSEGQVFIERLSGAGLSFVVPASPVGIAPQKRGEVTDLWIISVDCKVYCVRDVISHLRHNTKPQPKEVVVQAQFGHQEPVNVLDWVLVNNDDPGGTLVILSPSGLCVLREANGGFAASWIPLGHSLTCLGVHRNEDSLEVELVVGTREQNLIFLSLAGEVRKEVYLGDVPTAVHIIRRTGRSGEIVVGFARGTLCRYQLLSQTLLKDLEDQCDRRREQERVQSWNSHDFKEKIVLIQLAQCERLDLGGIHSKLDAKAGLLIAQHGLVIAVTSLAQKNVIREHIEGAVAYYAIRDTRYAEWVRSRFRDLFKPVYEHRVELIGSLKLVDILQIDAALAMTNEREWLFNFLLVDPRKWDHLLALSELMQRRSAGDGNDDEPLRRSELERICEIIGAAFKKGVPVEPGLCRSLSAFEIQIPAVKFRGFDSILTVLLGARGSLEGPAIDWIWSQSNWDIVLVIAFEDKELPKEAFAASAGICVLNHDDLKAVILSDTPREAFLDLLVEQIDVTALSPFQIRAPVTDMFYGRSKELRAIITAMRQPGAKNHAIIGPRRIGKTSLMYRVRQDIEARKDYRAIYLEVGKLTINEFYQAILDQLGVKSTRPELSEFISEIEALCQRDTRKLVLFLDEVDSLLAADEASEHIFSHTMRRLTNEANVKVLIAGYQELYRQMHDATTPMFNSPTPVELGPLERSDAFDLIEQPLRSLYRFDSRATITDITEKTGCYPNFIQCACELLLHSARVRSTRVIKDSDVEQVFRSEALRQHMVRGFIDNLDKQSKLLLYLMLAYYNPQIRRIITNREEYEAAFKSPFAQARDKFVLGNTFTPYHLHRLLELHNVRLTHGQLVSLMSKLVLASILKYEAGKEYSFVLSNLPEILANHVEVELAAVNLLETVEEVFGDAN
jgi:Cdc6-like AAA superfamily ATPase